MTLPEGRKPLSNMWYANFAMNLSNVTRVEIIDSTGRAYSKWGVKDVQMDLQDDERTLKIFVKD